ncbi:MAG: S8 family serine peptidase [Bacteroidota bacterium]
MRLIYTVALFLLLSLHTYGQIEVNVRLQNGPSPLEDIFTQYKETLLVAGDIQHPSRASHSWVDQLTYIQPLAISAPSSRTFLNKWYTLRLNSDQLSQLQADTDIDLVETNHIYTLDHLSHLAYTPNDDSLSRQWYLRFIQAEKAWDISQGSSQVKVGVIDTGLDFEHPEFAGQVWINPMEDANGNGQFDPWSSDSIIGGVSGDFDGIDNDHNGYEDDVVGYDFTDQPRSPFGGDFVFEDPYPLDDNLHGTTVSGIIHAKADNSFGIAGLAPQTKLVVLRAFAGNGGGEDDDIARSIIYAADNGVDVLNLSFGDVYPSNMMHDAIKYAMQKGVVMVSSAGNGTGDELHYPSGFNEVISVSASTYNPSDDSESLWPLSSYGLTVDLCAPGADILTTNLRDITPSGIENEFTRIQGTSFAAPMVAAAAALLLSERPALTPPQIRGILTSTADDISREGWDHFTGAGRLNMFRALRAAGSSRVEITSPQNDRGSAEDQVAIMGSVLDPEFVKYHIEYQEGLVGNEDWISITSDQAYQIADDTLAIWNLKDLPEGEYTLRIRLEKTNGFTAEDRIRFIRDLSPPEIEISFAGSVWDNEIKKYLVVFRASDQSNTHLYVRPKGTNDWKKRNFDNLTRNGEFLMERSELVGGEMEFYLESTNFSGLTGQTAIQTFDFEPSYVQQSGYTQKAYSIPIGRFVDKTVDLDNDQQPEVIMNEYNQQLSFDKLNSYEFRGGLFVKNDSSRFRGRLIPKDMVDTDKDGLLELLVSANDSSFLLEQPAEGLFPSELIYSNEDNDKFMSGFADVDGDSELELIGKDFKDYFVFDGADLSTEILLEDNSGSYIGSIAPRVLAEDFDGDGRREIVFGDFDGDIIIYEFDGSGYQRTFLDTTELTKSGLMLTAGDFDGDGRKEFFVATYPSPLRNDDFENNSAYMVLRMFKATANDQYEVVWEEALYDVDTENFNGATAGNLDNDVADELAISTYPRTYILDYQAGEYGMDWFYYGSLCTHHIIHDFDGNGVAELGLGLIDSTFFFEKEVNNSGPQPVEQLSGEVVNANTVRINWPVAPGASAYDIWRVRDPLNNDQAEVLSDYTETSYQDVNLVEDELYLYVLVSKAGTQESGFGNFVLLRPHQNPRLDSTRAISAYQLELFFSQDVIARDGDKAFFTLDADLSPSSIIQTGTESNRLILSFRDPMKEGIHTITVGEGFLDAERAPMDPDFRQLVFEYEEELSDCLILTNWEIAGDKEAIMSFALPLDESLALDTANYSISPFGSVESIAWEGEDQMSVRVTVNEARLGALGYAISITADLCTAEGICTCGEGNTATFSSFKDDLSEVFVYPNPYVINPYVDGIRFAQLTQQATIEVYSLSGRFIIKLDENDGDGGLEWNLQDETGSKIKPGVYLYKVSTRQEGVEAVLRKFTVVE